MLTVINLFGGPGCGKSTTAAGLFHLMKNKGYDVELVTEFAKDMVWSNRTFEMDNYLYIFAKQHHRLWRVAKYHSNRDVDAYVITDSPLLLSLIYSDPEDEAFSYIVLSEFNRFHNYNFLLMREKPFNSHGRLETEDEAKELDEEIARMLIQTSTPYTMVRGDTDASTEILFYVEKENLKNLVKSEVL